MTKRFDVSEASVYLVEQLENHGYEAVFVGGAVRDYLLGKQATDIDIATSAKPTEVKDIFEKTIDVGVEHGTILVLVNDEPIEVTMYRTGEKNAQHDVVKSLREDLRRRDFTINALAMTKDQQLVDFFGGQDDLRNGLIRAVESPRKRFEEDALRMLRAVRFASVLNFTIEDNTFYTMKKMAKALRDVAIERVKVELDKIFLSKAPEKGFRYLIKSDLHKALPIFPEKWVDLEKHMRFSSIQEGWAMFMLSGRFSANEVSAAYKLSNDEKRFLTYVEKAYAHRQEHSFTIDEIYFFDADILYVAEKFYKIEIHETEEVSLNMFHEEKDKLPIQSLKDLVVSGQDLLKWANVRGGPWVGEWMKKIEHAVLHKQCENNRNLIKEWFINDFDGEK